MPFQVTERQQEQERHNNIVIVYGISNIVHLDVHHVLFHVIYDIITLYTYYSYDVRIQVYVVSMFHEIKFL